MHYLAKLAGIETPVADSVVTFAQVLTGEDFFNQGRTLKRLGWDNLTYEEIKERIA
jgi:opine dehydrogenase